MSERWTRRDFIFQTLVRMCIWKMHGHLEKRNGSGPGDCGTGSPWLTRDQNGGRVHFDLHKLWLPARLFRSLPLARCIVVWLGKT